MIKVYFESTEETLSLKVKGHAGQDKEGKDIICSAASILIYTVAQCVTNMHKEKKLTRKPTVSLSGGLGTVTVKPKSDFYDEALHTYLVVMNGFNLLAHNFSEFVSIEKFGGA